MKNNTLIFGRLLIVFVITSCATRNDPEQIQAVKISPNLIGLKDSVKVNNVVITLTYKTIWKYYLPADSITKVTGLAVYKSDSDYYIARELKFMEILPVDIFLTDWTMNRIDKLCSPIILDSYRYDIKTHSDIATLKLYGTEFTTTRTGIIKSIQK